MRSQIFGGVCAKAAPKEQTVKAKSERTNRRIETVLVIEVPPQKSEICRRPPVSFCHETLSNGRCAVIDRAYSVDSASVGAVYDRPICSFETETSYEGLPSLDRMRERL